MEIKFHGQSCFELSDGEATLLTDSATEPGAGAGHDRHSPVEHTHHAILASLGRLVKMTIVDSRC